MRSKNCVSGDRFGNCDWPSVKHKVTGTWFQRAFKNTFPPNKTLLLSSDTSKSLHCKPVVAFNALSDGGSGV